jgi:hypothetical protein
LSKEGSEKGGAARRLETMNKTQKSKRNSADTTDYFLFGILLCMLSSLTLTYLKIKGYSQKATWLTVLLPIYLALA